MRQRTEHKCYKKSFQKGGQGSLQEGETYETQDENKYFYNFSHYASLHLENIEFDVIHALLHKMKVQTPDEQLAP